MAKKVRVKEHTREVNGKKVKVKSHTRYYGEGTGLLRKKFRGKQTSGHGELQTRRLGKKQQRELKEDGETTVIVSGEKKTLKKSDTIGRNGKRYQVYQRSDKDKKALRKPTKDHKFHAGHSASNQQKKPFEGD